jgi:lactate racemase
MDVLFPAAASALREAAHVDVVVALGTHPPMSDSAIDAMLGADAARRASLHPNVAVHNHAWDDPGALDDVGAITATQTERLTGGLLSGEVRVRLNRLVTRADRVILCGPVFPHEVAGYSGGAKYLFPGVAGPEIIDVTHWAGAMATSMATIGVVDTPVRRLIHQAASLVRPPVRCLGFVCSGTDVHGAWYGDHESVFSAAASLSAQLNVVWLDRRYRTVLSIPSRRYDDMWTAAKAIYKTEPVVADGGEVIVYAPWLHEVSTTHGALIRRAGYHVRDYFLAQRERFADIPQAVLAHGTHVRGSGSYDAASGIESPRIRVTLATGIDEAQTRALGVSYRDPAGIDVTDWERRDGVLVVHDAGERLHRPAPHHHGAHPS